MHALYLVQTAACPLHVQTSLPRARTRTRKHIPEQPATSRPFYAQHAHCTRERRLHMYARCRHSVQAPPWGRSCEAEEAALLVRTDVDVLPAAGLPRAARARERLLVAIGALDANQRGRIRLCGRANARWAAALRVGDGEGGGRGERRTSCGRPFDRKAGASSTAGGSSSSNTANTSSGESSIFFCGIWAWMSW